MRLAALSNEKLGPWVNWSTLGPPLRAALVARALKDGNEAFLVSPPPMSKRNLSEWQSAIRSIYRADALFWMQISARPELPLLLLSTIRGKVRRSAFVIDPWRPALAKIGALAVAQRLNPCFVSFREAYQELVQRFPAGKFEWLPFGVDTEVFDAGPGPRDIFAFWMGRRYQPLHEALLRYQPLHEALLRYCTARGFTYQYRTGDDFVGPAELGRLAGRSRYFVVTPPDLDNPARTGGFSPLVMRYMEGLSAGARLLGVLPRSGEYQDLLPRDAILEVAPDGSDLAERIDADMAAGAATEAVERARLLVRTRHSWAMRADQIYTRLAI